MNSRRETVPFSLCDEVALEMASAQTTTSLFVCVRIGSRLHD